MIVNTFSKNMQILQTYKKKQTVSFEKCFCFKNIKP